jgi:hypothetical protein
MSPTLPASQLSRSSRSYLEGTVVGYIKNIPFCTTNCPRTAARCELQPCFLTMQFTCRTTCATHTHTECRSRCILAYKFPTMTRQNAPTTTRSACQHIAVGLFDRKIKLLAVVAVALEARPTLHHNTYLTATSLILPISAFTSTLHLC